jgi:hypothetical protein
MNNTNPLQQDPGNLAQLRPAQFAVPTWLANTITPAAICYGLQQHVPEFAAGRLMVSDCDIKRLRLREDEQCWSGICLLTVRDVSSAALQTVSLYCALIPLGQPEPVSPLTVEPFGTAEWHCYLPDLRLALSVQPQGAKLTALTALTDPAAARRLLEASFRASGNPAYRNLRLQACQPEVMRYKPGSRCTILYHLQYPATAVGAAGWPDVVVAKTHHGDKGKIAYEGMKALWDSPLRTSATVTIAEPLAYLPAARVLVQGPIREELTLKALVQQVLIPEEEQPVPAQIAELYAYLRKTAAGLAELHQCGVRCGEVVTWEDELADIYAGRATLATVLPQITTFADSLLEKLAHQATSQPADPLVPAHRSFRPAQVLLHQGDIGFIDFDGFCQAEPALDLALFMTTIKNMARIKVKTPPADAASVPETGVAEAQVARLVAAEALCDFFLAEYERHAPVSRTRIALWETLQLLSLLLGSWKKLKLDRLAYCRFMLERHLTRTGLG